ncbi:MAG: serine/threonine protein phosphatase [Actinomycetota bacterium]
MALIEAVPGTRGWGVTRVCEVAGHPVFVKTIPVCDAEVAAADPTADVFDLPLVYRYGVGSAGVSAHRELVAHQLTTSWVLDGSCAGFPLLFHHRLVPLAAQTRLMDPQRLDRYVAYWDDAPAIRALIEARQRASHSLALFCEHVPHVLMDWLPANQHRVGDVLGQALEITDHLRAHRAAHFDANPSNLLTDGERLYFADLGLFLHPQFALSAAEQDFLTAHRYYDIAQIVGTLTMAPPGREFVRSPAFDEAVSAFEPLGRLVTDLFDRLHHGPKTLGHFDDTLARQLLDQARSTMP